ncbi:MAG: NAD(P)-dependent dehydrogenase (short-subunit alcohol dehydrogenase family) [Hyphomicrobiaceae bacterium]|jgi:NAD(P)-dependent dehydrogenase (short-subunit alcohol dehydrogenase family)
MGQDSVSDSAWGPKLRGWYTQTILAHSQSVLLWGAKASQTNTFLNRRYAQGVIAGMLKELNGKVAVVTGAGGGIGAALAEGLAARGMKVVVADIDEDRARATAGRIGSSASARGVDVAREDSVAALADYAFETHGQVDLLINNAGVFQGGLAWERSVEDWNWTLGVNVYGIIHAIRSFVPRMIAQDTDGHIVNTASVAAFVAGPFSSPYIVSKCAALSLSECLALDLEVSNSKIGASVLVPSAFHTGIAHTSRVRPERFGRDETEDGGMTVEALASLTSAGMNPTEAVAPVIEAVAEGTFLIPTKPSYAHQIRHHADALIARQVPTLIDVD